MNRVAEAMADGVRVRLKYKVNGQTFEVVHPNVHAANAAAAVLITGGIAVVLSPVRGGSGPEVTT